MWASYSGACVGHVGQPSPRVWAYGGWVGGYTAGPTVGSAQCRCALHVQLLSPTVGRVGLPTVTPPGPQGGIFGMSFTLVIKLLIPANTTEW